MKDNRNILLIRPVTTKDISREFMTSLQHALKKGIQFEFQVEEQEISTELIGKGKNWRIVIWESAEGGTGISEILINDKKAFSRVAEKALELCHFTGQGKEDGSAGQKECVAACYECLLSYTNQNEHRFIDRNIIKDFLVELKNGETLEIGQKRNRQEQYEWLKKNVDPVSTLETKFLDFLHSSGYILPDFAQFRPTADIMVQPDFYYDRGDMPGVCIFVDGPKHNSSDALKHDSQIRKQLEDKGFRVIGIRFDHDFETQIKLHLDIFGKE